MNSIEIKECAISSKPSFLQAIGCISGILLFVFLGLFTFKTSLHSIMLLCIAWVILHAYCLDKNTERMRLGMVVAIQKSASVFIIFVLIGAVIAAFTISGAIPALIYYGLALISPQAMLPVCMLLCSMMSLAIGTCWGTIGTIGAALISMALIFHVPLPLAAGAIVSGAYFGDKFSPISDTTILSALSAETDLYKHMKGMMYTILPAYVLSLILFWIISRYLIIETSTDTSEIIHVQQLLQAQFHIGFVAILPIIVMLILCIKKKPAEICMLISIVVALIIAITFQKMSFTDALNSLFSGPKIIGLHANILDPVLSRGGIQSMLWSMSLTLLILALGGLLDTYHFISVLFETMLHSIKRQTTLVSMTILTAVVCNLLMGEAYLSIILTSRIYKSVFKKLGLDNCVLSNAVEEGSTFSTPLIPWTTSGAFIATTLGVCPLDYMAWSIFNWLAPLIFICFVLANFYGIKMYKKASVPV